MSRRFAPAAAALAALIALCSVPIRLPDRSGRPEDERSADPAAAALPGGSDAFQAFAAARAAARTTGGTPGSEASPELVALAEARGAAMRELIRRDPQEALRRAVSWAEFEALPPVLRPHVERPFNALGHLHALPLCGAPAGTPDTVYQLELDGRAFEAFVFGRRLAVGSKEDTPLAGIVLDGVAAVREEAFEVLSAADAEALADFPSAGGDGVRCFASGAELGADRCVAIAAGKRFHFADAGTAAAFNARLAEFDLAPGPHAGAAAVLYLADGADGADGGFDWGAAGEVVENEASAWTETVKSVFFIRVDFADVPGEVVSQAALAEALNVATSDSILDQSYGKTWIEAEVSATTVRLPQPSTGYLPNSTTDLYNDAIDAYEAIAGAGALSGYDIIGVHFPWISMQSGTVTFSGLAGGSRQWLQGTSNPNTIIHEFGHNYGIGHASFWDTAGASPPTGAGSSSEYGDSFDIMGSGPDPEGHFHMQAKERLDWLEGGQWADIDKAGSGSFRVYRFDHPDTTGVPRGLRASKSAAADEFYWLGYRPGIPGNPYLAGGAYLLWQRPGYTRCWLLDTTPASAAGKDDAALALGTTYSDAAADIHFTPVTTGGAGAEAWLEVNVQVGPFPGNVAPVASIVAPGAAAARSTVTLSADASDANGDTLAYSWDFGDGSASPNSASLDKTWTVGGTYPVTVTVSDMKGGTATAATTVTVTDPLDTWSAGTVDAGESVDDVAYADGRFVAAGPSYAYLSFDGESWSGSYLSLNYRSGGVAGDGETFVLAGYDWNGSAWYGVAYWSYDGLTWTAATMPPGLPELRAVAAGGAGNFVAVGDDGLIVRSVDGGQSWSPQSAPGTADLKSVAYGGGLFMAVGGTSVYTSPDGVTWTDRSAGTGMASWHTLNSVIHVDGTFYAGGWYSGMLSSADGGASWNAGAMPAGASYDIAAIRYGAGLWSALGERRSDPVGAVLLVSADGQNWVESSAGVPDASTLTFGDGVFLTVFGTGESSQSGNLDPSNGAPSAAIDGAATADARTSVLFEAITSDPDGDPLILVWDFGDGTPLVEGSSAAHTFATGGGFTVTLTATDSRGGVVVDTHAVTVTDPLDTWTEKGSGTTADLHDIASGGGRLVAVGDSSGTYRHSADGDSWAGGTIGINIRLRGVVHDGAKFVAAGYDYDFGAGAWTGAIYTSADGTGAWTRRHFAGEELNDVAAAGGNYVACGDAGALWHSPDGINWTAVASGTALNLEGVSYGGGVFVVVGSEADGGPAVVLASADGLGWTDRSGGAGTASWQGFYDVQFCGDRFLASGWYSKLRHSTDGGESFATTRSASEEIPAFAFGNGIYLAAGIDRSDSNADVTLLSTDGEIWSALATPALDDRNAAIFFEDTFITVGDAGSIRRSSSFSAPAAGGFLEWLAANFPAGSGATDDPDGDGASNLAEYINGTDPNDADDFYRPSYAESGGYLTIEIPRSPAAADASVAVLFSADLETWSTAGTVVVSDTPELLVVRTAEAVGAAAPARGFLRPVYSWAE